MDMNKLNSFGKRLEYLLDLKSIPKQNLAAAINVSPTTISNYIKDNRSPDLGILAKIADFLNVNSDFLLMRTNNFSTYIKREVEGDLIEIIFDDEKLHLTSDEINKLFEQLKPFGFDPKKYFDSIDRKN